MKHWILLLFFLAQGGMHAAKAGGVFNPAFSEIRLPPNIAISGNVPVGSVIWTSNEVSSSLTVAGNTNGLLDAQIWSRLNNSIPIDNTISATNQNGIGVRWRITTRAPNFPNGLTESIPTGGRFMSTRQTAYIPNSRFSQTLFFQLVKTGFIQGGDLSISSSAEGSFFCVATTSACVRWNVNVPGNSRVRITTPTCSAREAINVFMPPFFPRPNNSTSPATPFSIVLICQGGDANSTTTPLITLTDASNRANTSNILSLSSVANAATGIGIQILRNNQPLNLGPENSTAAQWAAGTVSQGTSVFEIPLAARYVATGATVSTGIANGRAIFTLNYR